MQRLDVKYETVFDLTLHSVLEADGFFLVLHEALTSL